MVFPRYLHLYFLRMDLQMHSLVFLSVFSFLFDTFLWALLYSSTRVRHPLVEMFEGFLYMNLQFPYDFMIILYFIFATYMFVSLSITKRVFYYMYMVQSDDRNYKICKTKIVLAL